MIKKFRISILYAKNAKGAEKLIPFAESLSDHLELHPSIKVLSAVDKIKECDLIISSAGTGHLYSGISRTLSDIVKNANCPKIILTKGILSSSLSSKSISSLSYINKDGKIFFFPKNKYIDIAHTNAYLKKSNMKSLIKPWREDGDYLLFCAQSGRPPYFSYNNKISYNDWVIDSLKYLIDNSDYKILYRFHPKGCAEESRDEFSEKILNLSDRISISKVGTTINKDFRNAKKIITYNSGVSVKSIVSGIQTVVADKYFTGEAAIVGIHNFKKNIKINRERWLKQLISTAWSKEELINGRANEYIYQLGLKDLKEGFNG